MNEEKQKQEALRDRVADPARRWQDLMDRITWAEKETVHRATPAACIRKQRRLWASMQTSGHGA